MFVDEKVLLMLVVLDVAPLMFELDRQSSQFSENDVPRVTLVGKISK
jgi:hypothetical protein